MNSDITVLIVGLIMITIGIVLRVYVSRNRFYRSSKGWQQFSSYSKAVGITFVEKLIRFVGTILLIGGIFFLIVVWFNHKTTTQYREGNKTHLSGKDNA